MDSPDSEPAYAARLFGPCGLVTPDGRDVTPRARKTRALIAYCLLESGERVSRERLNGLLWGGRGEEQARGSLRQAIYELRDLTCGPAPLLASGREGLTIEAANVVSDLDRMRAYALSGDALALAQLIGDRPATLLTDLDHVDPSFDEWLAVERGYRDDQRRGWMMAGAERALAAGDAESAGRLAAALLHLDPLDDAATRLAMTAAHATGDTGRTRHFFERHALAVRHELGVEPSPELFRAYQAMTSEPCRRQLAVSPSMLPFTGRSGNRAPARATLAQSRWRVVAGAAMAGGVLLGVTGWSQWRASPAQARTLMVEPLTAARNDASAQALRDGLSADLARMIVGSDTTLQVVDPDDAPTSSGPAGTYRVVGEAAASGGVIHAAVRLLNGPDAAMLWSSNFSQSADQIDALRQRIASKVADVTTCALGGANPATEVLGVATTRLYLAACEQKHGDWRQSAMLLRQVVQQRPHFAHAWAMLAAATAVSAQSSAEFDSAKRYARQALSLDPGDGEAYFAGSIAACGLGDCVAGDALINKGLAVEPTNSQLLSSKTNQLMAAGRIGEALHLAQSNAHIDPFAAIKAGRLAGLLALHGDLATSDEVLDHADEMWPDNKYLLEVRFWSEAWLGEPRRAFAMLDDPRFAPTLAYVGAADSQAASTWRKVELARLDPASRSAAAAAAAALAASARNVGSQDVELMIGEYRAGLVVAAVAIGRIDEAYAIADHMRSTDPSPLFAKSMAPFRADPRFMRVAAGMGLVDTWRRNGRWPDFCTAPGAPYDCRVAAARVARPPSPGPEGISP